MSNNPESAPTTSETVLRGHESIATTSINYGHLLASEVPQIRESDELVGTILSDVREDCTCRMFGDKTHNRDCSTLRRATSIVDRIRRA